MASLSIVRWSYAANGLVWIFIWWENKKRSPIAFLPPQLRRVLFLSMIPLRRPPPNPFKKALLTHLVLFDLFTCTFQSCTAGWQIVGVCSNPLIVAHCRLIYDHWSKLLTQGGIGTRNNAYANTSLHPLVSRVCCRYSGANSTCHLAVRVMT